MHVDPYRKIERYSHVMHIVSGVQGLVAPQRDAFDLFAAAFPAGTGICHCFINNADQEALLLVGGEAAKHGSRIVYPLNPSRRADMQASEWWDDAPPRPLGPHDGLPDALRS